MGGCDMWKKYITSKILKAFSCVHIYVYTYTSSKGELIVYDGNLRDIFFRSVNNRFELPNNTQEVFNGSLRIGIVFSSLLGVK